MTSFPTKYERAGSSKVLGCLVYVVVAPFVALSLALFIAVPTMFALEALGLTREQASAPFLVLLPLVGVGVAAWGYRDYRRRAALEVVIDRDQVTTGVGSHRAILRFEDVDSIRLVPTKDDFACVLVSRSGRVVRLPPEIAPLALVHEPLELALIPQMVRRLDERIARGEVVTLKVASAQLLLTMSRALGTLFLSVFLLVRFSTFAMGIRIARHATLVIRQTWLGFRSGVVIENEGLQRLSTGPTTRTSWDRLERIRNDPLGLVLRSTEGRVFVVSALADNFWPALRWIDARVR